MSVFISFIWPRIVVLQNFGAEFGATVIVCCCFFVVVLGGGGGYFVSLLEHFK